MSTSELSPVDRFVESAYREADKTGVDRRRTAVLLEPIRIAFVEWQDYFKGWNTIDQQIGRTEDDHLRSILIDLRKHFVQKICDDERARLHKVFSKNPPEVGWKEWLRSYVEALAHRREELCLALLSISDFPPPASIEKIWVLTKYVQQQRWAKAYELFPCLAKQETLSNSLKARMYVIAAEIQLDVFRRPDKVENLLRKAEKLAPHESNVICGWGKYQLQKNQLDEARKCFQEVRQQDPQLADGYIGIGDSYSQENNLNEAEEWYREAIIVDSGDARGYLRLMRLYGRPELITMHKPHLQLLLERAIAVAPEYEYKAYIEMGIIYQQNQDYPQAYIWYDKAIGLDDLRLQGYISKGYAYLEEKNYPEGHNAFQKIIDIDPESFEGYWGIAWLHEQQEQWQEALHFYKQSLPHRQTWKGMIRGKIGEMYWHLDQVERAKEELIHALQCEPDNKAILVILHKVADTYFQKYNNPAAALQIYRAILEIVGQSYRAEYQNRVGIVRYYCGEYKEAVDALEHAAAIDPDMFLYRYNLASAYQELKEWDKASAEMEKAWRLQKNEGVYHKKLARLLNAQGKDLFEHKKFQEAIEKFERAVEFDPSIPGYSSDLALARENVDKLVINGTH